MNAHAQGNCRRATCANSVPAALRGERLCLDHFLDEGFHRADYTLDRCRAGRVLKSEDVEWLLADALAIVQNLEEQAEEPHPGQRDRMLELLLVLGNLHEYVARHAIRLDRPA